MHWKQKLAFKGLLVTSGKPVFIVGADITEFTSLFGASKEEIKPFTASNNRNFNRIASLPYPSAVAINGFAMGGGLECCLACDFRVMSTGAKIGLPETKLGILPAWGGTVRLPRIIGVDEAVMWMATGAEKRPADALKAGAVDAIAAPEQLRAVTLATLQGAIDGSLDYQERRARKHGPLPLNDTEAMMSFFTIKAMVAEQAGKNYPAPIKVVDVIEAARNMSLEDALEVEADAFAELATTPVASALVGVFLNDQLLGKKAKGWEKQADKKIERAAVLGAGIMGGGIAYQSAFKGTPIKMKDIAQDGLDLGLSEATKLLAKRVDRGRMSATEMGEILSSIDPTLTYAGFDDVDIVVEAVVENEKVKGIVLAETEQEINKMPCWPPTPQPFPSPDWPRSCNGRKTSAACTSSTRYTPCRWWKSSAARRPPTPLWRAPWPTPTRWVKRRWWSTTAPASWSTACSFPISAVSTCPAARRRRLPGRRQGDGALGLAHGPRLPDGRGGHRHRGTCGRRHGRGFPRSYAAGLQERHRGHVRTERYGQKNGKGFYEYVTDKRGKPQKTVNEEVYGMIADVVGERVEFEREDIIARMMLPMAIEMARCVEEGIVGTPAEADLALLYGVGFPPFRGGIFRWMDTVGMAHIAEASAKFAHLGKAYELTEGMQEMLANGETYY